jgi:peptide/nickel transport system permease protein
VPIGAFLLRRLGLGLVSMLGVSLLVFLFLHLIPGDPVDHLAGGDATPEQRQKLAACMSLDQPAHVQFGRFLGGVADGTLGHQCPDPKGKPTVMARIVEVYPHTVWLALCGMAVALVMALPLDILAAIRRGSWVDTLASVTSLSGIAIPMMMMGPLLLLWFFLDLGLLPGPTELGPMAMILPAIAVGTHLMAMLARMTRSSMVEVLGEDFLRTARAKGLPEKTVIVKLALSPRHPARNSAADGS